MTAGGHTGDRGGFALALVVLMLFAIAVAGMTGYQVVSSELSLATQNRDGQKALSVARAGLQRFLGETVGQVGDSVAYAVGDGVATVTTRRVYVQDSFNHLYYIRSVGTVADARTPTSPATRTVGTYAWHRMNPIPQKGALWVSGGTMTLSKSIWGAAAIADGADHAVAGTCTGSPTASKQGVVTGGANPTVSSGGVITPGYVKYAGFTATYDTVGVRWDILKNQNFPVDFNGSAPPAWLPSDSFPLVRYNGNLTARSDWRGRGVLIVTGTLTLDYGFYWEGIVLAGALANTGSFAGIWPPEVHGMLIGGLNGTNSSVTLSSGYYYYNYCKAYDANQSLSYLEVVDDAIVEING